MNKMTDSQKTKLKKSLVRLATGFAAIAVTTRAIRALMPEEMTAIETVVVIIGTVLISETVASAVSDHFEEVFWPEIKVEAPVTPAVSNGTA